MPEITTELLSTDLGKAFLEVHKKSQDAKRYYRENEIGEQEVIRFNEYKAKTKYNPYAMEIANAFDKMVSKVIPENVVLSTQFKNWINSERNNLLTDSKISRDSYFNMNYETGEVGNKDNRMVKDKVDYLNKELGRLEKSFTTFLKDKPQEALANEQALQKWQTYYAERMQFVNKALETRDFSSYDKKDKEGNVIQVGSEQDALKHRGNIEDNLAKINEASEAFQAFKEKGAQNNTESQAQMDYVGDADLKKKSVRM